MTTDHATSWVQQPLFPPDVVTATLSVGIVASANHLQLQLEIRSTTDDELIGLKAWPSAPIARLEELVAQVTAELLESLQVLVVPFP